MAATHQLGLTYRLPKGQRPGFSALTHECCLEHAALLKRQQVKNFIKRHEKVMRQQCVPSLPSNCFRLWGVKITVYTVYIWSAVKRQLFSQTWRGQTFSTQGGCPRTITTIFTQAYSGLLEDAGSLGQPQLAWRDTLRATVQLQFSTTCSPTVRLCAINKDDAEGKLNPARSTPVSHS